jgi:hypothetical protein
MFNKILDGSITSTEVFDNIANIVALQNTPTKLQTNRRLIFPGSQEVKKSRSQEVKKSRSVPDHDVSNQDVGR